jgi:predicted ribosomally synthesized peptide with SipW-like signal peptide
MNLRKILLSVFSIGVVALVAVVATSAFFSDTEKSEGNVFVAGKLDLRFQHGGVGNWEDVNGEPLFDSSTFDLTNDLKPGDWGEKTVRLWVDDNPACGNIKVDLYKVEGVLNEYINFMVWEDMSPDGKCDNIWNNEEPILALGPLTEDVEYYIGNLPVTEDNAKCYGIAYCFGDWENGVCDGSQVGNDPQSDSFKADLIITAMQERHQFPDGCPIGEMKKLDLENKDDTAGWVIVEDDTWGTLTYSSGSNTFNGTLYGQGLVVGAPYQFTFNGPGGCSTTDHLLANYGAGPNYFIAGYWNNGTNLESSCSNPGEGVYNVDLTDDDNTPPPYWFTARADADGKINKSFNLSLPVGNYSGVKVLVKRMLDPFQSPWAYTVPGYAQGNLYETAPINFTVVGP